MGPEKLYQYHKSVVILGGGTGPWNIIRGVVSANDPELITAVPTTWDDGKSTGILRTELGILPPGDARRQLVALMEDDERREIFLSLFEDRVKGHAIGNLVLARLDHAYNGQGLDAARKLFRIKSRIFPITTRPLKLVYKDERGKETYGEHHLDERALEENFDPFNRITSIYFSRRPVANKNALTAIEQAQIIISSPGSLIGSVAPFYRVPGFKEALANSDAELIQVLNVMSEPGQTDNFTVSDHLEFIVPYLPDPNRLNYIVVNDNHIPARVLEKYKKERQVPVTFDPERCISLVPNLKFIYKQVAKYEENAHLLRHDPNIIAEVCLNPKTYGLSYQEVIERLRQAA